MQKICNCAIPTKYGATITVLYASQYSDGNLAVIGIFKYGDETEESAISVNIPDQASQLQPGEFFLKSWSEREGMLTALLEAGIITHDGRTVPTGYVQAPIVRLSDLLLLD